MNIKGCLERKAQHLKRCLRHWLSLNYRQSHFPPPRPSRSVYLTRLVLSQSDYYLMKVVLKPDALPVARESGAGP
jgi:hypothetical protein